MARDDALLAVELVFVLEPEAQVCLAQPEPDLERDPESLVRLGVAQDRASVSTHLDHVAVHALERVGRRGAGTPAVTAAAATAF